MSLVFPLSLPTFWSVLPVDEPSLDLGEALQIDRTAGGTVLIADLGERLWQGRVTFGTLTYAEAAPVEGLLDVLRQSGRSFLCNDLRRLNPLADPSGSILGAASVTVTAIPSAREVTLGGLPAGYVLSPGDYLGWGYDGALDRRAFHRVVDGGTASGGGALTIEVVPTIRPGLVTGAAVVLKSPSFRAHVLPGSAERGRSRRRITEGGGFGFVQTLRQA